MELKEYYGKLGKKIISCESIRIKTKKIASKIKKDYAGQEICLVANLKGSFRFLSGLVSCLQMPTMIDFVAFASYEGTKSMGEIRIIKDLKTNVRNKNVIIVEDIVDTGITLNFIIKYLRDFKFPKTIKVCTLLDKPGARKCRVPIHYKCFSIQDPFIVGYGLDYNEYYRELNDIYILKDE